MCGIAFVLRSSTSFTYSGSSPASSADATSPGPTDHPSPAGSTLSAGSSAAAAAFFEDDPSIGILLPDGTRVPMLDANDTWEEIVDAVRPRGPDLSNTMVKHVAVSKKWFFEMRFHASILHMRGDHVTPQPFVSPDGDVLLFNGEVFDGLEVGEHENDGQKLFDKLQAEGPSNFFAAIRNIEGPYAFVYYQASNNRLYYGRDPLGRRSLLMHPPTPENPFLVITSNGMGSSHMINQWEDVSCDAIHCFHFRDLKGKSWTVDGRRGLSSYPRYPKSMGLSQDILIYPFDPMNTSIPTVSQLLKRDNSSNRPIPSADLQIAIQNLTKELHASVRKRVISIPRRHPSPAARVAVLFSGGIDCTTLALLVDKHVPAGEAIDLINVAFENPRKLAAAATLASKKGKGKAGDGVEDGSMDVDAALSALALDGSSAPESMSTADPDQTPLVSPLDPNGSSISPTEPFEDLSKYEVPDRLTGRQSLEELRKLRPQRTWNFVEANIPYEEMMGERQRVIDLMRPNQTVMDLSIAIAFFFAARGKGVISDPFGSGRKIPYDSPARVVMSGLGADELLGGYARHRRAFKRHPSQDRRNAGDKPSAAPSTSIESSPASTAEGNEAVENWAGLIAEMQMDLDRLPYRNLGRDDRIVSYHGKEARYPFLAANVVDFCCRTRIWLKCDMRFGEGVGDKLILRLLATRLGLTNAATLKKRAIHFGARTAKMELESGKDKGEALVE